MPPILHRTRAATRAARLRRGGWWRASGLELALELDLALALVLTLPEADSSLLRLAFVAESEHPTTSFSNLQEGLVSSRRLTRDGTSRVTRYHVFGD